MAWIEIVGRAKLNLRAPPGDVKAARVPAKHEKKQYENEQHGGTPRGKRQGNWLIAEAL